MAEFSPLAKYNEVAKEFGITGKKRVATDRILEHVQIQASEMTGVCNRLLIDIVGAYARLEQVKDTESRSAYEGAISKQKDELRQYTTKLDTLLKLQSELEG